MKKSDKKIENAIRTALTNVCNIALETVPGFKWITHKVNYRDFPESLTIVCVFENDDSRQVAQQPEVEKHLHQIIQQQLAASEIKVKNLGAMVRFSTEDAMRRTLH